MSYTVSTTRAIVLRSFPRSEADRSFELYTRDFGRIDAHATGIRLLKSKLRYALQTHSLALVSLVHGRREWKIVNALPVLRIGQGDQSKTKRSLVGLVVRLIAGELRDPELFDFIEALFVHENELEDRRLYSFGALSLLMRLGYFDPKSDKLGNILYTHPSSEILESFSKFIEHPNAVIDHVLSHSHL